MRYARLAGLIGLFAFALTVVLPAAALAQPRVALALEGTAMVRCQIRFNVLENDMGALGRASPGLLTTGDPNAVGPLAEHLARVDHPAMTDGPHWQAAL